MADRLKGRVAVITGSGQGIGRATALMMAKEGAKVVTNNRFKGTEGGDAETTAKEIIDLGGEAVGCFADVSKFSDAEKLIKTAVDNFGRVDILVNNAAIVLGGHPWEMSEETWDNMIAVDLKGVFNTIRFSCGIMKDQGWGRIINATSPAWLGTVERIDYCAVKAGVVGITRAVARDLGQYGATCNAYSPRAASRLSLRKPFLEKTKRWYDAGMITKEKYEEILNPPSPDTVAVFLTYLCTDEAANINGRVFYVTGGVIGLMSEPVMINTIYNERGMWQIEELIKWVPDGLLQGYKNPAPPQMQK